MSAAIDDGGPAFPHSTQPNPMRGDLTEWGMTLRDWFAGQALAGWLASYDSSYIHPAANETSGDVAKQAYQMADAMIAARKQ